MPADALDNEVEEFSKRLFGSGLRLPVAAFVAEREPGVVSVGDVVEGLELPAARYTAARLELEKFAASGLLMRLPKPRGQRIQYYERIRSPYWEMTAKVISDLRSKTRAAL
jgi:hypothetical protein